MIPFVVSEPEQALFQDGIVLIPQRECEAQQLLVIGNPSETILAPVVCPRTRLFVRKIAPCISVGTVVLTDGTPLSLAEVRSPLFPWDTRVTSVVQALLFRDVGDVL